MLIRLLSVDEVMWCRQQSVNHQELLCSLHCATTVVLREQLNCKSAVIRSERSSCCNRAHLNFQVLRDMKMAAQEGFHVGQKMSCHLTTLNSACTRRSIHFNVMDL